MSRKRVFILAVILLLLAAGYYFYCGHTTPKGQPPLLSFGSRDLTPLKNAFNSSASSIRVVVMLSPTWAYCLQGASATGQLLREINNKEIRVFVVWEPVLPTDFTAPSTAALARISDTRASQYWDRKRALSRLMGEHDRHSVVWDYIAVYAKGTLWEESPPKPDYSSHPVRDVIAGARESIQRLLARNTNSAGGQE